MLELGRGGWIDERRERRREMKKERKKRETRDGRTETERM